MTAEERPARKTIRLPREQYLGERVYFVTICCAKRRHFFSDPAKAKRTLSSLRETAATYGFAIHAYCMMPDHLHFLAGGLSASSDLLTFVNRFKSVTAQDEKRVSGRGLWQRYFYDHILRPRDSGVGVAWYIWLNPVRKGLCLAAEDYPFSGSFTGKWPVRMSTTLEWVPPWKNERLSR